MSKHTPGPYRIWMNIPGGSPEILAEGPQGQLELATVHREAEYQPGFTLPYEANAQLFAAAPNMLKALQLVIERVAAPRTEDAVQLTAEVYDLVCAAIAEAEGI